MSDKSWLTKEERAVVNNYVGGGWDMRVKQAMVDIHFYYKLYRQGDTMFLWFLASEQNYKWHSEEFTLSRYSSWEPVAIWHHSTPFHEAAVAEIIERWFFSHRDWNRQLPLLGEEFIADVSLPILMDMAKMEDEQHDIALTHIERERANKLAEGLVEGRV